MTAPVRKVLGYIGAVVVTLAVWELASLVIANPALPAPADAFRQLIDQLPVLLPHFWISTARVLVSVVISLALGAPLGLLLGRSPRTDAVVGPLVFLNYPLPKAVFVPVLWVLIGIGDESIITLITVILFFQIVVTTRDAARSIPNSSVVSVRSLGANRRQVLRHVIVPAALPEIFTALRITTGTAVAVLFFSETVAGSTGLGYYIFDAWGRVQYGQMFAGILAMALLGVVLYESLELIESRVCRWVRAGRS